MVVSRRTGRGEIDTLAKNSCHVAALARAAAGPERRRRGAPAPLPGRAGRHALRLDQRPARPHRRRRRPPADRVRTLPAARPHAPRGGHDARDRGRPRLRHDRQPRQLPDAAGAAAGAARPAARRPARDRALRARSTARRCAGRSRTTCAARARCARELGPRRDFYGTHAAVDDVAAVLDALRIAQRRPLRRLLRHVRRPGLRRPPRRPAALAGARRRLSGDRHRPGVQRPRRGDPARAAARVRAAAELRRPRRGPDRGGGAAGRAAARAPGERLRASTRTATASASASTSRRWRR